MWRRGPVVRAAQGVVLAWAAVSAVGAGCAVAGSDLVPGAGSGPASDPPAHSTGVVGSTTDPVDGGGDGVGRERAALAVRDAARRTAALPTARYLLTLSWQGNGQSSPVLQVDGQVDLVAGRSSAVVRQWLAGGESAGQFGADGAGPNGSGPTEVVVDGSWLYVRSGSLGQVAGTGSSWLRLATGPDDQPLPSSVTGLLTLLELAVSAEPTTADTVAGVPAQRSRVWLAAPPPVNAGGDNIADGTAPPQGVAGFVVIGDQVVVWVGDDGLVRAIEAVVQGATAGTGPDASRLVLRYELVEVGAAVDITVPAANEVVDVNPAG